MATIKDEDVMIRALRKERDVLHERLMQIDRIIKRVKAGDYVGFAPPKDRGAEGNNTTPAVLDFPNNEFPKQADVKIQVIKVFDALGQASRLGELQKKYFELSGSNFDIRETVRALHRARLLRMIRVKDATRGMFWVKVEWMENGILLDEHKPVGFDLIYKAENLMYE
ncbi:MAG: hypothetical protein JNK91_08920 [Ferruginibacter sp.]|nr:hypothetical protein [Ferruginibacter sp.]